MRSRSNARVQLTTGTDFFRRPSARASELRRATAAFASFEARAARGHHRLREGVCSTRTCHDGHWVIAPARAPPASVARAFASSRRDSPTPEWRVTFLLTLCLRFGYRGCESRSVKDAFGRGYSRKRSECGARGREDTARSRAAWASSCRHYDRRVRCFTGLGQARRG